MEKHRTRHIAALLALAIILFPAMATADCRGCCSGHGGTVCSGGVTKCKDGTPLSDRCVEKGCDRCGGESRPEAPPAGAGYPVQSGGNTTNDSFNRAKRTLEREVYHDHRITFYCGCPFDGKELLPCDKYEPKRDNARSKRIEWEHVVPAADFGRSFREWREGHPDCAQRDGDRFKGRNCARKTNIQFRFMEADLYNLVPAIGEINGLRSNYRFGMVPGEDREFGSCDFELEDRIAEPPERIRGDIARTYLYMHEVYPGHGIVGRASRRLLGVWDRVDLVDPWECERARRIERLSRGTRMV